MYSKGGSAFLIFRESHEFSNSRASAYTTYHLTAYNDNPFYPFAHTIFCLFLSLQQDHYLQIPHLQRGRRQLQ